MPRVARIAPGGLIYHVLNRGVGKMTLFRSRKDFEAFQRCVVATLDTTPMRVLAYCVMKNHWHLVLWPQRDGDLARFMMRLTIRHVRRWLIYRHQVGTGHVYQGRYKSFVMQEDGHLATVCRYVERNPVRAKAVERSGHWPWSSAGQGGLATELQVPLTGLPIPRRKDWVQWVDEPQTATEEAALRRCLEQGRPYGEETWVKKIQRSLGWREPMKVGRPRKKKK
jgi:putative transposase